MHCCLVCTWPRLRIYREGEKSINNSTLAPTDHIGREKPLEISRLFQDAHCPKINQNFRDITRNVEKTEILNDIVREVSRFPRYIS